MPPRRKTPAKKAKAVAVTADTTAASVADSQETADTQQEEEDTVILVSDVKDDEQSLEEIEAAISNVLEGDTANADNAMDTSQANENEADETLKDDSESVDNATKTTESESADNVTEAAETETADQDITEDDSTDDKKHTIIRANFSKRSDDIKDFQTGARLCHNQRRIALFPVTWEQLTTIPEIGDILTQKTAKFMYNVYDSTQGSGLLEMVFNNYKDALAAEAILFTVRNDENAFTVQHNKIGQQKYNSIDEISCIFPQHTSHPGKQDFLQPEFGKKVAYVFNLPESCDEDRLKEQFPEAVNIWLPRDPFGNSKCEAYLEVKDEEEKNKFILKYAKKTAIDDYMVPVFHLKLPDESASSLSKGKKAHKRTNSGSEYTVALKKKPKNAPSQGVKQPGRFADRSQGGGYSRGDADQGHGRFGGRDGGARSVHHGRRDSGGRQNQRWNMQQSYNDDWSNDGYSQSSGYQANYAQTRPQQQIAAPPLMGSMPTQDAISLLVGLSQLVSSNKSAQSGGGFGGNNPAASQQSFHQSSHSGRDFRNDRTYQGGYNDNNDQSYGGYNDNRGDYVRRSGQRY